MTKKTLVKSIAMAMAAVVISLPLTSTSALAASRHDASPAPSHRVEMRQDKHKAPTRVNMSSHNRGPQWNRHQPAPRHESKHHSSHSSSTGNFITGAIIGAILGSVIANNAD